MHNKLNKLTYGFIRNCYKVVVVFLMTFLMIMTLIFSGCSLKKTNKPKEIKLSIWCADGMQSVVKESVAAFNEDYKNEVKIICTVSEEDESACKDNIVAVKDHAPDIFTFPDDQFDELYDKGILLRITDGVEEMIDKAGGKESIAVSMVTRDSKVYAFPHTSGNGYFLYYNKEYFSEDDVKDMDTILKIARKNGKKFSMDFESGWYTYAFFKGAGLDVHADITGTKNECNYNAQNTEYKGIDVAESMLKIASDDGFVSLADEEFLKSLKEGKIIAGVNGPWNANIIKKEWGDNYAATKLPTYTLSDDKVQMCSFMGYKLMGINSKTEHPKWCMKLASYLNSSNFQLKRYNILGECPAYKDAADSEKIKKDPAMNALSLQSEYASAQRIVNPFWAASKKFGIIIAGKNSGNKDLQQLLDTMTEEITKEYKE